MDQAGLQEVSPRNIFLRAACRANRSWVPHISLVFREIWDTAALFLPLVECVDAPSFHSSLQWCGVEVRGIPHLAKNERDVGHPSVHLHGEIFLRHSLTKVGDR